MICDYCGSRVSASAVEAEDGCCPNCGVILDDRALESTEFDDINEFGLDDEDYAMELLDDPDTFEDDDDDIIESYADDNDYDY